MWPALLLLSSVSAADLQPPVEAMVVEAAGPLAASLGADEEQVRSRLSAEVAENLRTKGDLGLADDAIRRTVVGYEAFKWQTYVSAGVFPKRYFGYFDTRRDTEAAEWRLREVVGCTTRLINAHQEAAGSPVRVNHSEVAVTFIAEGGALLLRENQRFMNRLDPIQDVGLDDVAKGSAAYPGLLDRFDAECGTDFASLFVRTPVGAPMPAGAVARADVAGGGPLTEWSWRMRDMRYEEGIAGTAFMWLWEKELAAADLKRDGRTPMQEHDLAEQFILSSLVYNSGLIHRGSTMRKIKAFDTADYLFRASEKNAQHRPRLALAAPAVLAKERLAGTAYRDQQTSWNAAYHVLQRYGAWEALRRFTDTFDDQGNFVPRHRPAPAPVEEPPPAPAKGDTGGCWGAASGWLAGLGLLMVGRGRG